ncbi:STAS domain-containing protein [Janibacter sp. GXQ6167]|uniref:STAS domain-containing protein n=1 Tax=Janibacter sp. GXQ6167 TaxID=3240791 RepID=UPI003525C569
MALEISTRSGHVTTVVTVTGEIDVASTGALRRALTAAGDEGERQVVADLSGVTFIDSSGIGVLIGRTKAMHREGGALAVVATHERVLRTFALTGVDQVLAIHATVDEAVHTLAITRE